MSDSSQPYGLQHTRLLCPPLSPRVCSDSCILELVMLSNHLILCCPFLSLSVFPSIRVFSSELALHIRWPKYWSFSFSPSNRYAGLISIRIDWFDLLAAQEASPAPQLESISSLSLSLLYSPTLTFVQIFPIKI